MKSESFVSRALAEIVGDGRPAMLSRACPVARKRVALPRCGEGIRRPSVSAAIHRNEIATLGCRVEPVKQID
jgi:hypothetical protein